MIVKIQLEKGRTRGLTGHFTAGVTYLQFLILVCFFSTLPDIFLVSFTFRQKLAFSFYVLEL